MESKSCTIEILSPAANKCVRFRKCQSTEGRTESIKRAGKSGREKHKDTRPKKIRDNDNKKEMMILLPSNFVEEKQEADSL